MAQQDAMADAIKRALAITMHHEELCKLYEGDSESLLSWIRVQTDKLTPEALEKIDSTPSIKLIIDAMNDYKNTVKPTKQQALAATEAVLANLHLSQRNNERPMYAPSVEIEVSE